MPRVNPAILEWARETAGLTLEDVAPRLIGPTRDLQPADRLRDLESGDAEPSRVLLAKMAKRYRRPLVTFYLPEPPRMGDRGTDFRTLPAIDRSASDEAILDALMRNVLARQALVRSVLEAEEEAAPLPFVGSATTEAGVPPIVNSLRRVLGLTLEQFRTPTKAEDAFRLLRDAAEAQGVFVTLQGDLGSHHTNLDLETFRGFALADPIAPFVVINTQDSPAAMSFTLLHELTHIWLGLSGVSGARAELQTERFCNDVASEYLLPEDELAPTADFLATMSSDQLERIRVYAGKRNVSSLLVVYRLYRRGSLGVQRWRTLRSDLGDYWREATRARRAKNRRQDGGPSYYVLRRHRIGQGLLATIDRMLLSGAITTTKAGMVLGVKPKNVAQLLEPRRAAV